MKLQTSFLFLAGADLVKDAGKRAACVTFEGELAVLANGALRDGPLQ